MKLFLILLAAAIVNARVLLESDRSGFYINDVYHEKVILKTNIEKARSFAIDRDNNILYLSSEVDEPDYSPAMPGKLDLNTWEFTDILPVVSDADENTPLEAVMCNKLALDTKTHSLYIGCDNGLFRYTNGEIEKLNSANFNNLAVACRDNDDFYYVKESRYVPQRIFKYSNGSKVKTSIKAKINSFVFGKANEIFYFNNKGVFSIMTDTNETTKYLTLDIWDSSEVNAFVTDIHGILYLSYKKIIYFLDKSTKSLKKVVELDYPAQGLAFDKDNNIIYSDRFNLMRLVPTPDGKYHEPSKKHCSY